MSRLIDLSHPLYDGSPSWPGDPGITVAPHCLLERDGCRVSRLSMGTHQGTHADAPAHFLPAGSGIDAAPLSAFYGPAKVLRIPRGKREAITAADLAAFDGALVPGARVLIHTGWDARWGLDGFFLEGPFLSTDAARLLAKRRIALLGLDMATPAPENAEEVHRILMEAGITILEGLANLGNCPDAFTLCAFPLLLKGLDGSPVRAVAIVD
jgi:kynurenine formamidase